MDASKHKPFAGFKSVTREHVVTAISLIAAVIHLYAPAFGIWASLRPVSVTVFCVMIFAAHPLRLPFGTPGKVVAQILDLIFIAIILYVGWYVGADYHDFQSKAGELTQQDIVIGCVFTLTIIEATRRTIGRPLVVLVILGLIYAYWGQHMPAIVAHKGVDLETLVDFVFVQPIGIYGLPVGVTATYIVLFILFGAALTHSGAGTYFIEIARSMMGTKPGGPAKMAIVSSALMGSMSGSAVANVVTTGSLTIPLMMRTGLRPRFAAAVEAVASTGGLILPPVMGAAAFVMAEIVGLGYGQVITAAAIPGLLYYFALYCVVHFESRKTGMKGVDPEEVRPLGDLFKECWWIFIPIIVLFVALILQYSALRSVSVSLISLVALVLIFRGPKFFGMFVFRSLDGGARAAAPVMIACAAAGIIIAVIFMTGIGLRFTSIVLSLAGHDKFLVLLLTMTVTLVLGLGLPVTASYLTASTLAVPVLQEVGVDLVAAHMFVLYFSALSAITPPVALATYAASGIAKSNLWSSGVEGVRIGLAGYIIPFFFCYGTPLLILNSSLSSITLAGLSAMLGIFVLSLGLVGFFLSHLNGLQRIMLIAGGGLLIHFNVVSDAAALALIILALGPQMLTSMKARFS